jgi:hypothetical protein
MQTEAKKVKKAPPLAQDRGSGTSQSLFCGHCLKFLCYKRTLDRPQVCSICGYAVDWKPEGVQ